MPSAEASESELRECLTTILRATRPLMKVASETPATSNMFARAYHSANLSDANGT